MVLGVGGRVWLHGAWEEGPGHSGYIFVNLRAAIFRGLKGTLSLRTPAHHNEGLFAGLLEM